MCIGISMVFQWLGLLTLLAKGPYSIAGQGTTIPQAGRKAKKKKKKKEKEQTNIYIVNVYSKTLEQ